jgi:ATP-dependent DNA helicase DinG
MTIGKRFTKEAASVFRAAVAEAGGREVFAVGTLDEDGLVCGITVGARGSRNAVPALQPFIEAGGAIIHNHPSGELEPSEADLSVASRYGNEGIAFYIVDNEVASVYVVAEPTRKKRKLPLEIDALAAILEEGGKLSERIPGYESRPSQVELLRSIARSFNEDLVLAAEAGTGVGKSFAYLIPAFAWAERNQGRVVVSTGTINLQQQLVEKDIPVVRELLGSTVPYMLVKGRGNYLCLNRLDETLSEDPMFLDGGEELRRILEWSASTETGDRAELSFLPEEALWSRVCSEADTCLNLKCPRRDGCFALAVRRRAAECRLLVVNHHLLFSDLEARLGGAGFDASAVLPPFKRLVIDEAHAIEASATSFFSESMSRFGIAKQVGRLLRSRKNHRFGLLIRLERLRGPDKSLFREVPADIQAVKEASESLDSALLALFAAKGSTLRVTGERTQNLEVALFNPITELQSRLLSLHDHVMRILEAVEEDDGDAAEVYETKQVLRRVESMSAFIEKYRRYDENPDTVFWMEKVRASSTRGKSSEFYCRLMETPISIAPVMRKAVFEPFGTVAMTSATLTVDDSFGFWASRIGFDPGDEGRSITGIYPSPFPYRKNVLLCVPADAPPPESGEYPTFLARAIGSILAVSNGRALVLFTSYESLRFTYDTVKPGLDRLGIPILRQGDDDRSRLLTRFKTDVASVLFATDSFWEGVDVPGESLSVLVICRLPFRVPTDPVLLARTEAIRASGRDPFSQLSLPDSVVRFKQGFGRLIRSSTDRGVVVVLDSRIISKGYGDLFLRSLPETRRSMKPLEGMLRDIESFLFGS